MSRRTALALWIAAACGALALVVWAVAFRTDHGQAADLATLNHLNELRGTWTAHAFERLAHLCDPMPFALLSVSIVAFALVTGGVRTAIVVGAILLVPNVLTQELKTTLAEDRPGGPLVFVGAESWPSGHSTAAMALAIAATIAAPGVLVRWLVGLVGAGFALVVGTAVVVFGWHLPSDVVGGFAVAGAAGALGVAALRPVSRPAATTAPQSRSHRATG